ncbi:tryptophan-rich sensory protein [Arthrobacter gengyunqii]|uniref:Tryptophan-rich sensory protein n=1 Tax=Arthrobacter gengyunqii TaxID=2886940 RepID=A0A9X1M2B0_9MICC|nr:tryptophan-rich sensory protein [Arthrobacter gengyunqii]MCC3266636.1 tryptophan-rich sensory protein [Arthrobacter gengyunqii]MCC3269600.1 tryptophan-rich sensory protein [Arthrobacter gengyunqii]UOY97064.1 tryptophan-rich sensory protein [Arthrobacter gengyunqii]
MTTSTPGTRSPASASPGNDLARQLTVTVCYVICIVGSVIGVGVFGGTPIAEAAGGALNADATYLAPASGAFSIWSVIYTGLGAYTVWQWLPSQRSSERQRALGWLVAASLVLNAAWILTVQAGWVAVSVLVIVALLVVLAVCFARYSRTPAANWIEAIAVDGTLGLYLGWVAVATCANTAAALTDAGFDGFGLAPEVWSVAILAVVAALGVALAAYGRGRLAPAAALSWGLSWIAVSRLNGELLSTGTAVAAIAAAAVVALAAVVYRVIGRNRIPAAAAASAADR